MVEHGNLAKQEKEGRLLDIKREVTEMVRNRVTSLQFQVTQPEHSLLCPVLLHHLRLSY
jgi:hypothetical protein